MRVPPNARSRGMIVSLWARISVRRLRTPPPCGRPPPSPCGASRRAGRPAVHHHLVARSSSRSAALTRSADRWAERSWPLSTGSCGPGRRPWRARRQTIKLGTGASCRSFAGRSSIVGRAGLPAGDGVRPTPHPRTASLQEIRRVLLLRTAVLPARRASMPITGFGPCQTRGADAGDSARSARARSHRRQRRNAQVSWPAASSPARI